MLFAHLWLIANLIKAKEYYLNDIERFIHNIIADIPWLRSTSVYIYQLLLSFCRVSVVNPNTDNLKIIEGCFFGFHDKVPWSTCNNYLLSHRFEKNTSVKKTEKRNIDIGYFSENENNFKLIANSATWNWQQGSMLQWLGSKNEIIFNDYLSGECARIFNIQGLEIGRISRHIGAVSACGSKALCYNFGRLRRAAKEYGYSLYDSTCTDEAHPFEDGLWLHEFKSGKLELLLSLGFLAKRDPCASMEGAYHYVTHAIFNASSKNFCFLHRWRKNSGKLYSRLYVYHFCDRCLELLPINDTSHLSWYDNNNLLIYGWNEHNLPGYYMVQLSDHNIATIHLNGLHTDGHPQVNHNGLVVTDSYPDRYRMQKLYIGNPLSGDSVETVSWRIPLAYRGSRRCDYHPRWDRTGKRICYDTAHTGTRSLCVLNVSDIVSSLE